MNVLEDLKAQREGLLGIGFWALLVYRFGHARFAIRNKIVRAPWTIVYMVLNKLAEIFCGIVIGSTAKIGRRLCIEHHGCIVIHGNTVMGDDCLIRHGVTLGNSGGADPFGAPTVGDRVDFGAGAKVLKELIQHHVKEEESTFWSDARDNFSTDERKLMNQKYLAVKKKVALR